MAELHLEAIVFSFSFGVKRKGGVMWDVGFFLTFNRDESAVKRHITELKVAT